MGGRIQRPDQYYPPTPYIMTGLADVRYIRTNGGRKELSTWISLMEIGNEERNKRFTKPIGFIAQKAMLGKRACQDAIHSLARLGLIRTHQAGRWDQLTIELVGAPRTASAAKSADGPAAKFADIKEELPQKKLRQRSEPRPIASLLGKTIPRTIPLAPSAGTANDSEGFEGYATMFFESCRGHSIHESARFVATGMFTGRMTKTLENLVAKLSKEQVFAICREVYSQGQSSKPPHSTDHRAAILTARLKDLDKQTRQEIDHTTTPPEATPPGGIDIQDAGCQGVVAQR
ncbi:MAG TPA: hypothetical protein PKE12_02035 [Kiritimatiellia bacterium]|nr:hypothetical protein [Kiritimatiellia bacterium]